MPRTRCPHCQTIQPFEDEERGATKQCSSCEGTYRVPGAAKDKAVQPAPKPQPKAETAGRGAAKRRPPDEEEVDELDALLAADPDEDEDVQIQADRPRERRAKKDEDDDKPRRRKKRRQRRPAEGFSLVDTLPIDYISQVNIGIVIYVILDIMVFIGVRVERNNAPVSCLLGLAALVALCSFLWACAAYAKNKNYSQWLGLLGLLSLLGLIVLVILPTRPDPEDET